MNGVKMKKYAFLILTFFVLFLNFLPLGDALEPSYPANHVICDVVVQEINDPPYIKKAIPIKCLYIVTLNGQDLSEVKEYSGPLQRFEIIEKNKNQVFEIGKQYRIKYYSPHTVIPSITSVDVISLDRTLIDSANELRASEIQNIELRNTKNTKEFYKSVLFFAFFIMLLFGIMKNVSLKQFFKPTKGKLILSLIIFLLFILLIYFGLLSSIKVLLGLLYIFSIFAPLNDFVALSSVLVLGASLIYVPSCFFIFIYERVFNKKIHQYSDGLKMRVTK